MNQNLVTLFPLIILAAPFIIIIVALKVRSQRNQNGSSYRGYQGQRTLCRSQNNRVIAGVCGGIAEHFGWNATIVRLFFLFTGIGLFTYIVLSLVIPDSDTPLL